jgi:hypothetical protein
MISRGDFRMMIDNYAGAGMLCISMPDVAPSWPLPVESRSPS